MATKAATKAVEQAPTVADILEETSQVIEDTLDLMEAKTTWLKTTNAKIILVGVSALALGAAASYAISAKRLKAKYQKIADEQVEDVKRRYSAQPILPPKPDLETLAEKAAVQDIRDENGYAHYDDVPVETPDVVEDVVVAEEPTLVQRNIFDSTDPETYWDWDEETERRELHPDRPFVITKEEFDENETNYSQVTLTYFDGDGVLTDEVDQIVPNDDMVVGDENMLRFGHASGDPMIVYIRNNKLEADYEVVRSEGSYSKDVLGVDSSPELRHSDDRRPRKFRERHDG